MAILNYTTSVDADKSIAEIQKVLVAHGATKIVTDFEGGLPSSITFCLMLNGSLIGFCLPANYSGVLKSMTKDVRVPRRFQNKEQAMRVSWRIVKDWVKAQMAIVDAQLADMAEVFLPYAITKNGNTLYKEVQSNGMLMLQSPK